MKKDVGISHDFLGINPICPPAEGDLIIISSFSPIYFSLWLSRRIWWSNGFFVPPGQI
jgi:hypothetical protein